MSVRILIVDDEANVLRTLGYALGALEYEIVPADSAQEGLRKAVSEHPDLVILNADLPDMAGAAACLELRRNPQTSDVPIIMLSRNRGLAAAGCIASGSPAEVGTEPTSYRCGIRS